nr:protein 4b [Infectious bronchitis virus]
MCVCREYLKLFLNSASILRVEVARWSMQVEVARWWRSLDGGGR